MNIGAWFECEETEVLPEKFVVSGGGRSFILFLKSFF